MENLEQLKKNADTLRTKVLAVYLSGHFKSVREISLNMDVPYTCLRSFLLGKGLSDKNLMKIKNWLEKFPE